ncbi:MAG: YitT family protein [Chloroflexi bacterium]|nr:YitT family protein [Chloroflexota bacterium]
MINRSLFSFTALTHIVILTIGALIMALGAVLFQIPFNIASGGLFGAVIVLNEVVGGGLPIGLTVLVLNIPILVIAFRVLGGWRVMAGTVYVVVLFTTLVDLLVPMFPSDGVSRDMFLNALYAGIIVGIGTGLVFRVGGTTGGTSVLGRILQVKFGLPMSTSSLYVDGGVVMAAGLVFGLEGALYALVTLFVYGLTADYVLDGPSVIRTATIITQNPRAVADGILYQLGRGVTAWEGMGMYTEEARTVLYVTVSRSQIWQLRALVSEIDETAFIVVGQGHTAYGGGFKVNRMRRRTLAPAEQPAPSAEPAANSAASAPQEPPLPAPTFTEMQPAPLPSAPDAATP